MPKLKEVQDKKIFIDTPKTNPKDRIEVIVGDDKQPDFKPQVKLQRWDNEVNLSVRFSEEGGEVTTEGDKIRVVKPDKDLEFYELEPSTELPEGGFEFEVILKEKPASNVLNFTLETKELDFYYQLPLTQEEIDEGAERPENVVGSYAVYHKTKKNNRVGGMEYKTGKAFHIYRPFAEDSQGTRVWCELNVTEGNLSVTVPQGFLDKAVYPVIVDPTFGYTTAGSSSTAFNGTIYGSPATLSENGTIESMSVATTGDGAYTLGALFDSSKNLLGQTGALANLSSNFRSGNLLASYEAVAGTYYLMAYQNCNPNNIKYDTGVTDNGFFDASPPTTCDSSYTFDDPGVFELGGGLPSPDNRYSIYATYTAEEEPAADNVLTPLYLRSLG